MENANMAKNKRKAFLCFFVIVLCFVLTYLMSCNNLSADKETTNADTRQALIPKTSTANTEAITYNESTSTDIKLISLTSPVAAGNNATIQIKGKPNTLYNITVYYKSGASTANGLYDKTSDKNGYVTWTWKIGGRTSPGSHKIVVSDDNNSFTTFFVTT